MSVRSIVPAGAAISIATLAIWSATALSAAAAQPPGQAISVALARVVSSVQPIVGNIASGSASAQQPGFDPGPYPSWQDCEDARAQYYDPSQLECVPA